MNAGARNLWRHVLRAALAWTLLLPAARAGQPCRIEVVEQDSGWPVPLVELRTTHNVSHWTDNAGVIAIGEPELLGRDVFFHVEADGYEVPKDGFGYRGVRLHPEPGKTLRVEVNRAMVARRLGRLTGGGLFGESQQTGRDLDWRESGVFGSDSVQTVVHGGRRLWLWGDTTLPHYPLGIFDSAGAFTEPQPLRDFLPPLRVEFDYVRDAQGRPRGITPIPGDGPTWATALVSLPDAAGKVHLVCTYMKIRGQLEAYEWGLAEWNERAARFDRLKVLWSKSAENPLPPPLPQGHAVPWTDGERRAWMLFAHPFPALRCPATLEAWRDPTRWEVLAQPESLTAADSGKAVRPHRGVHAGGMGWHPWRNRWVAVFQQVQGEPSPLGELWYAEAESPNGPWGPAVKVLSHRRHTFYNPCLHLDLTPTNSPVLLFEGTYTKDFSGQPTATPRHDYNQVLYRLDLDDPRLQPARR